MPKDVLRLWHDGYANPDAILNRGARNAASSLLDVDVPQEGRRGDQARAVLQLSRSREAAGDIAGALSGYLSVRAMKSKRREHVWAGESFARLAVRTGLLAEAAAMAVEVRLEGADPDFCDWVVAQVRAAQGRHQEAWELLKGINIPRDSAGMWFTAADVLQLRTIEAARLGHHDEAVASAIAMMAGHGRVEGFGRLLLTLWGERPSNLLAELLSSSGTDHTESVARELEGAGGQEVSVLLRSTDRPA